MILIGLFGAVSFIALVLSGPLVLMEIVRASRAPARYFQATALVYFMLGGAILVMSLLGLAWMTGEGR